jgi:hypothetical protein
MRYANLIVSLMLLLLAGCGNESKTSAAGGPTLVQGKILSDEGPVSEAVVKAIDAKGQTLASVKQHGDSRFRIQIPADAAYPVLLSATFGQGQTLEAVITNSLASEQDITPYSDLVVKSARTLGGLTPENIARAARGAIGQRGQRAAGFAGETPTPPSGSRPKHASGGGHGH